MKERYTMIRSNAGTRGKRVDGRLTQNDLLCNGCLYHKSLSLKSVACTLSQFKYVHMHTTYACKHTHTINALVESSK